MREQLQHVGRMAGNFRKAWGPKSSQVWRVDEYAGSTCYLVSGTTDTGYSFSCWTSVGCLK